MEPQFWSDSWKQGGFKTSFHQPDIHPYIRKHLTPEVLAGKTILVPLCGKSADILYFAQHAKSVIGVDIIETAIQQFFDENSICAVRNGNKWSHQNITLYCRNFMDLTSEDIEVPDILYDRAALVALPPDMQNQYVNTIRSLLPLGAIQYVNTLQYSPKQGQPPFSVPKDQVAKYYTDIFDLEHLEAQDRPNHGLIRAWGLEFVTEHLFQLTRV